MVVFSKIGRKNHYLEILKSKMGRKNHYLVFLKSKMGRKNHYLEILKSKIGRKNHYSQKLCFDRIFAWKEYNFLSGFLTNTILNFAQEWKLLYPTSKNLSSALVENKLCTQIIFCFVLFCFDIQNNLCKQHVLNMFSTYSELTIFMYCVNS